VDIYNIATVSGKNSQIRTFKSNQIVTKTVETDEQRQTTK